MGPRRRRRGPEALPGRPMIASAAHRLTDREASKGVQMSASLKSVGAITLFVHDPQRCAELATRGVGLLNGPMNREWGMRTAAFTDPDGHIWEIAQELERAPSARA